MSIIIFYTYTQIFNNKKNHLTFFNFILIFLLHFFFLMLVVAWTRWIFWQNNRWYIWCFHIFHRNRILRGTSSEGLFPTFVFVHHNYILGWQYSSRIYIALTDAFSSTYETVLRHGDHNATRDGISLLSGLASETRRRRAA